MDGQPTSALAEPESRAWSTRRREMAGGSGTDDDSNVRIPSTSSDQRGGSAIGARGLVRAPSPRQLADIAPTVRQLFGLTAEAASAPAGAVLSELLFAADN